MNIREFLKRDQGVDVRISAGNGCRDDPYVVENCSAEEAALTQVRLLRAIEHGRGELWRIVDWKPSDKGSATEVIRIEALWFTPTEVITETRRYYFNTHAVFGTPYSLHPLTSWRGPLGSPILPYELGWLHFDTVLNNATSANKFDQTIQYSGAGAKVGVSVYVRSGTDAGARDEELKRASAAVTLLNPELEDPWPVVELGPFATKAFLVGSDTTMVGVAVSGLYFVKVRLTFVDDIKMRELMTFTLGALCTCLKSASVMKH